LGCLLLGSAQIEASCCCLDCELWQPDRINPIDNAMPATTHVFTTPSFDRGSDAWRLDEGQLPPIEPPI
jgi:hypothetical protein